MTEVQRLLADNIKSARQLLDLSQVKLAEKCRFSTSFLGEIEIGRKFPSPKNLQVLAEALGLKPYQLFFDQTDWKEFERFQVLGAFAQKLKSEINIAIEDVTTQFTLSRSGE